MVVIFIPSKVFIKFSGWIAKLPNWLQSLIVALCIAGVGYATYTTSTDVSVTGLIAALTAAALNWLTTELEKLKTMQLTLPTTTDTTAIARPSAGLENGHDKYDY
jgi:hypothetical protein